MLTEDMIGKLIFLFVMAALILTIFYQEIKTAIFHRKEDWLVARGWKVDTWWNDTRGTSTTKASKGEICFQRTIPLGEVGSSPPLHPLNLAIKVERALRRKQEAKRVDSAGEPK